ncbi:MAG TPA: 7-cyano-7-deazaguanine synthase [Candidatus Bilamarchaeum sp.]|nr:7-cyano-7-deazaguanine synthase [Candidatus Bilamarchaeum sp.]
MGREKIVMDKNLERKLGSLRRRIRKLDSALVAFSGGVDSTFLTRICREELGEKAVAVTALSDNYPKSELSMARRIAKIVGVRHVVVDPTGAPMDKPVQVPVVRGANIYSCLKGMAMRLKVKHVLDGSHTDDVSERGRHFITARRAGVKSPLLESDLSKAEIRLLAKEFGLPNWDKPPSSPRPKSKRPDAAMARDYLSVNYPGATLRTEGTKALILAGRKLSEVAKNLEKIERKLRALGFSEVLLKVA